MMAPRETDAERLRRLEQEAQRLGEEATSRATTNWAEARTLNTQAARLRAEAQLLAAKLRRESK